MIGPLCWLGGGGECGSEGCGGNPGSKKGRGLFDAGGGGGQKERRGRPEGMWDKQRERQVRRYRGVSGLAQGRSRRRPVLLEWSA